MNTFVIQKPNNNVIIMDVIKCLTKSNWVKSTFEDRKGGKFLFKWLDL